MEMPEKERTKLLYIPKCSYCDYYRMLVVVHSFSSTTTYMGRRWLYFPLFSARARTSPSVDMGRRAHTNQTMSSEPHSPFLLVVLLLGVLLEQEFKIYLNDDVVDGSRLPFEASKILRGEDCGPAHDAHEDKR